MSPETYIAVQNALMIAGGIVETIPLAEFIAAIDKADAAGPVLNPTFWRAGHNQMAKVRRLAVAAQAVAAAMAELAPTPN